MGKPESFDRQKVMDQVTNVFWSKGYNGTSMQDIVDATGLNRSSIYNSFGDKQQLYKDTLKHYKMQYQSKAVSSMLNKGPRKAIRGFFESVLQEIEDKTNSRGCYLSNCTAELSNQDHTTHDFLTNNLEEIVELFADIINRGKEVGEFKESLNSKETALYLFSSLQGLKITGMLVNSKEQMETVIDHIFSEL